MDLLTWVRQQDGILTRAMMQALANRRQRLADLSRSLPPTRGLAGRCAPAARPRRRGSFAPRCATARGLPAAASTAAASRLAPALAAASRANASRSANPRPGSVRRRFAALTGRSALISTALSAGLDHGPPVPPPRRGASRLDQSSARLARSGRDGFGDPPRPGWRALPRFHPALGYTEKRSPAATQCSEPANRPVTSKAAAETHARPRDRIRGRRGLGVNPHRRDPEIRSEAHRPRNRTNRTRAASYSPLPSWPIQLRGSRGTRRGQRPPFGCGLVIRGRTALRTACGPAPRQRWPTRGRVRQADAPKPTPKAPVRSRSATRRFQRQSRMRSPVRS